ncbi:Nucleotidyltransferase [Rickenella mellea]|uniref:DNA-directed DNA polymerase n=1 Tax=Rickenella mellea TaxID=50990 RepID=A0A4Y7PZP4_9AGAM|nr:Nucleotidyltransferase [Rickenella mellea]
MGFKRPRPLAQTSSSSSIPESHNFKRARDAEQAPLFAVPVYIIQAKLDAEQIDEMVDLAEDAGAIIVGSPEEADVLITAISMRKRLERHVDWNLAKEKAVVTPQWLYESAKLGKTAPCGDYVAIQDLHDTSVSHCPGNDCTGCPNCASQSSSSMTPDPADVIPVPTDPLGGRPAPTPQLDHLAHYCVQRASPLTCPNQRLVETLAIVRRSRELEGEARSSLSYQRAIAGLKAYPIRITSRRQVAEIPFAGSKIQTMIMEFVDTGQIGEAVKIASSERFRSLNTFSSVYGIGPTTARSLYDKGLRTFEQLERAYEIDLERDAEMKEAALAETVREATAIERGHESAGHGQAEDGTVKDEEDTVKEEETLGDLVSHASLAPTAFGSHYRNDEETEESGIRVGIRLHHDLSMNDPLYSKYTRLVLCRIPRGEVEEMCRIVTAELEQIQTGCIHTIVGGYRRGKPESNDVDIVFTHPEKGKDRGLCQKLVDRLRQRGMVTHVMHLSSFRAPNSMKRSHWDSLEKSLTVFVLPPSSPFYSGTRRRLDLIFAPAEVYWCAVIGWTGSTMFQRDLRKWTKDKRGWKFDSSGMVRLSDSSPVLAKSELEIFELCGLEWVDPTLRNADA